VRQPIPPTTAMRMSLRKRPPVFSLSDNFAAKTAVKVVRQHEVQRRDDQGQHSECEHSDGRGYRDRN
jgi:hypothetical protein